MTGEQITGTPTEVLEKMTQEELLAWLSPILTFTRPKEENILPKEDKPKKDPKVKKEKKPKDTAPDLFSIIEQFKKKIEDEKNNLPG